MAERIGIDIGGSKMLLLVEDEAGRRVEQLATGKAFTVAEIETAILRFVHQQDWLPRSIGIAVPGIVDSNGQVVGCSGLPNLEGWSPHRLFQSPTAVRVLNDAEAALVEEAVTLETAATAAVIIAGTDIGAAFLVDGRVLRGARGWAGELGSIPVQVNNQYQTLDAVAGGAAILKRVGASAEQMAIRVKQGDAEMLHVIRDAGTALGAGLACVINLLNPSVLVLAGGTLRWSGYFEAALQSAQTLSLPKLWESCTIRRSLHGELLVALGAARAAEMMVEDHV